MDQGLFIARLVIGLLMAGHGAQKAFGWFGGYGLAGTGGFMESIGFRPGRLFAAAAAYSEVIGGLLITLGLLGPVGPALVLSVMIVAAVTVHWNKGLFVTSNGIEVPLLYARDRSSTGAHRPGPSLARCHARTAVAFDAGHRLDRARRRGGWGVRKPRTAPAGACRRLRSGVGCGPC